MQNQSVVALTTLLLLFVPLAASATEADGQALIELNRRVMEGYIVEGDPALFEEIALDQFLVIAPGGKVETKTEVASSAHTLTVEGVTLSDEQVIFEGNTGVVIGKILIDGEMRPIGRLGPMKFMAVFVREGETWKLLSRSLTMCHEMAVRHGVC